MNIKPYSPQVKLSDLINANKMTFNYNTNYKVTNKNIRSPQNLSNSYSDTLNFLNKNLNGKSYNIPKLRLEKVRQTYNAKKEEIKSKIKDRLKQKLKSLIIKKNKEEQQKKQRIKYELYQERLENIKRQEAIARVNLNRRSFIANTIGINCKGSILLQKKTSFEQLKPRRCWSSGYRKRSISVISKNCISRLNNFQMKNNEQGFNPISPWQFKQQQHQQR